MQLREKLNLPPQAPIAVFSGRLVLGKQVDLLLEIWRGLQIGFKQSLLLIIGSGGEEARLRQMNVENVRFAGQVDDVAPYLQSSDFFVLPSTAEGLSNALLEALAVGLPCVATAVGGTPDVIVDGENGLLVAPDKPHDLQAALSKLLTNISMRQRMGKLARETILARYSLENTADRLAALYQRLAKERKAKQ
jgi:glycosyltransferase involved in cell wall biosynthesis